MIEKVLVSDLEEILSLQKIAYISEAEICNDFSIPPLLQTFEEINEEYKSKLFLKVVATDKIVGSVRAYEKEGTCHIGKLIVHPGYRNNGIGTALMNEIENIFGMCKRYELFTGKESTKNIYLYTKVGYKIYSEEKVSENLTFVYMEKKMLNR